MTNFIVVTRSLDEIKNNTKTANIEEECADEQTKHLEILINLILDLHKSCITLCGLCVSNANQRRTQERWTQRSRSEMIPSSSRYNCESATVDAGRAVQMVQNKGKTRN